MATQNVNIGINISDNGSAKKVIKDVNSLHSSIKATQASAEKLSAPKAAGFRGAASPTGTDAQLSNQEYNRGRGSMGATGASARDFANQAQGLGGLVRLYATYAANIFAVSAAFRALSGAMDTANLVRGLDQLGASSGTALGTLSKRLVEATDGAISLREAMEATAKASSSGMSSENILRMGKVAKQAAQALGVDMADAVNRLTRGITKLEPELLDEIGIFTKVDMATQAYAKSIGKSTSAITDFEKRMAFANAVLAEGEKKFSAIDFETNPYTKLVAALKDVSQVGLELVNKVLGPLVKFLSENPTALAAAMAAVGAALVKQALPALGQLRAGLRANAAEALATADAFKASFGDEFQGLLEKRFRIPDLEAGVRKAQQDLNSLKVPTNIAQSVKNLASDTASTADIKNAQKAIETRNRLIETGMRGTKAASAAQIQAAKEEIAYIKQSIALYERKQAVSMARAGTEEVANIAQGPLDPQILALKKYETLRKQVDKSTAISNAAQNAQIAGIRGSWSLLNQEISDKGITGVGKYTTLVQGGLAAVGSRVMGIVSAFGHIGAAVAAGAAVLTILDAVLGNNAKELAAFSKATESASASIENLNRTIDKLNEKPFGNGFDTASLLARANAINEITASISDLIAKSIAADKAANWWDNLADGIKSIWGGDLRSQFADSMSSTVFETFDRLKDSPETKKARDNLAAILNVSPESSRQEWEDAFKTIADSDTKLAAVKNEMKALGTATGQAADDAQQFDIAMKQSKESLKNVTDQFKVKDPIALFAESIISASTKTAQALKEPESAITRLTSVIDDPKLFEMFSAKDQRKLIEYGNEIKRVNAAFDEQTRALERTSKEAQDLKRNLDNLRSVDQYTGNMATDDEMAGNQVFAQAKKELDAKIAQQQQHQKALANTETQIVNLTAQFPNIAANQLIKGANLIADSISASFAKANTAFGEAVLAAVGDLPGVAKQRADMEARKLESEARMLKATVDLTRAQMLNTYELKVQSAKQNLQQAESAASASGAGQKEADALASARKSLDDITKAENIVKLDIKQPLLAIQTIKSEVAAGNAEVKANAAELFNYVNTTSGLALQQLNNLDAKAANKFKELLATRVEAFTQEKKNIEQVKQLVQNSADELAIEKERNGLLTAEQIAQQGLAKSRLDAVDWAQQSLIIQQKIDALQAAKDKGGKFAPKQAVYEAEMQLLKQQQLTADSALNNKFEKNRLETLKQQTDEIDRQIALAKANADTRREGSESVEDSKLNARGAKLNAAKEANTFTPAYQEQLEQQLAIDKMLQESKRNEAALTREFEAQLALDARRETELLQQANTAANAQALDELWSRMEAENAAYEDKKTAIALVTQAELDAQAKIAAAREEQKSFENLISTIQTLSGLFGDMGAGIAGTVEAFQAAAKSQKQYAASIADIEFERDAAEKPQDRIKWEEKLDKTKREAAKSEISNYGKVAGSAKMLFKEKSTGYKVLAAVEKTMHITKLAMDVAEMVSDTTKTGVATANSATRTGASIIEAGVDAVAGVIKAIASMPFPINIIAGVATAAVMAGLLSQIGGSKPTVSAGGFSAEDRQETQGTGMSWVDGKKVENGGGVFGDPTQKLDSINKGIQTLKDNSIDGLFYDNRMLKAMEAMAQSMTGVATALFAVPGITSGLNFGTLAGSSSKSGIPIISKLFGGSSSTTKEVEDVGVQLRGNLESLIASQYKDIVTTTKKDGGLFFSDKTTTSRSRETQALGADINMAFIDIFNGAKTLFTEIGSLAGVSAQKVIDAFRFTGINLDVSLKGLTGTEALEELNAVISSQLDKVARSLFSGFDKFRKFGEGFTDTVIRVVDGNMKVTTAVSAMGLSINKLSGNFDASERIINNMAGSLANFNDQAKFFIDNFLTDAERLAIVQKGVTKALAELALPTELTREEFKKLVQMQDLTTESGRMMYQRLMDIQEGFFTMTERLEEMKSESINLEIELLKVTGNTAAANAAIDALATQGMTRAELETYNYNKALNNAIDAVKAAEAVEAQKASLQQKMLQVSNDTVALRTIELNKLDESNRALQVTVWTLEYYTKAVTDAAANIEKATQLIAQNESAVESIRNRATDAYVAATDKVATAQNAIANLAIEAAKKMQTLGKTLREFVSTQLNVKTADSRATFTQTVGAALGGDAAAMEKIPELAQAAIDAARAKSGSSQQFNLQRSAILAEVNKVAKVAEERAALTQIPTEQDPLVEANRNLESALKEQTKALEVVNTLAASLVKTPEDLIELYRVANLDLAAAILRKSELEIARAKAQKALDDIVGNTGNLIKAIIGSTEETKELGKLVEKELRNGVSDLDKNLDGKLTYKELVLGLKDKASDAQIKELMDLVDLNADASIDAYELELFNSTQSIVAALGSGFSLIDTNLDGKVSEQEFIKAMTGKASDNALKAIFDLVDGDNDKIISATELTAAKSVISAENSDTLSDIDGNIIKSAKVEAIAADQTINAVGALNNLNLLTITNNTATTILALEKLIKNNVELFNAMNSVAKSTAALAESVKSGSGGGTASSSGGGTWNKIFGQAGNVIGSVVDEIFSWFSDRRTKTNITPAGTLSNGISLYDYNYKAPYSALYGNDRKRGVIAQEVMGDYPEAISKGKNGMYMVDYSKLPIPTDMLKFAAGGVFSNSVITRPTGFELGLMGEAGPEAVMPLSRTRGGQLGVVAQTAPGDNNAREMLKQNAALITEVKNLREEVSLLRHEARATASATTKTTRLLERVTQNGDSLLVTDTATV